MADNFNSIFQNFYNQNILTYIKEFQQYPIKLVALILDIIIVAFLAYQFFRIVRDSRAWQLIKGIILLVIANAVSGLLNLNILHYILSAFMNWGVVLIIVLFQPELRRALEQLGTNKITKYFGIDKNIVTRTKEDIYKIALATTELAKAKKGALIVIQRDIEIKDIISTGIKIDAEVSPQLLVNIFEPNTPLHDGAVVIGKNKIEAAACMLPLSHDKDIASGLGTRHRAALGVSQESDSIAVVVSEESGKISVAKDGILIVDVKEDVLKRILINNIVTKRLENEKKDNNKINKLRKIIEKQKNKEDAK